MRTIERVFDILTQAYLAMEYFCPEYSCAATTAYTVLFLFAVYQYCVRMHYAYHVLGFAVYLCLKGLGLNSLATMAIWELLTLNSLRLRLIYGDPDFSRLEVIGEYEVGFMEFRTEKKGNQVAV